MVLRTSEGKSLQEQWNGDRALYDSLKRWDHKIYSQEAFCAQNAFRVGVVIPTAEGRQDNLARVIDGISAQIYAPEHIVIVCDGWSPVDDNEYSVFSANRTTIVSTEKHIPGKEQPKNVGVRHLPFLCNHVWFLDSDVLPGPYALQAYKNAYEESPPLRRVFIGPYEWMKEGQKKAQYSLHNDPRWEMFRRFDYRSTFVGHLGVALACFGGNMVWPVDEFKRVGGFWNDLHAGRCEDGEMGIRATSMSCAFALVRDARGFHIHHKVNTKVIHEKNKRDVPMINERHPYVQDEGLIVADYDGARFNQICQYCGKEINTLEYWLHAEECATEKIYA
jgi:hypothetical protein